MKILNKVVIGMASLVLLTACGPSKVSYDKFHEKAVEALKAENGYTKAVLNGSVSGEDGGVKYEVEFKDYEVTGLTNGHIDLTKLSIADAAALLTDTKKAMGYGLVNYDAASVKNDEGTTYYAGDTFKCEFKDGDEKGTVSFNKYGLLQSLKGKYESGKADISVKWSK